MSTPALEPHVQSGPVPIRALNTTLTEIWTQVSAEVERGTGKTPLRTATLTLAIIATSEAEREEARQTILAFATATPARALLFGFTEPGSDIVAHVSAHCAYARNKQHGTCYDIIDIDVPRDQLDAIPNIISGQRIGELPAFIFWTGEVDLTGEDFLRISRPADRLIIDSEQFSDRLTVLHNWQTFLAGKTNSFAGGDLAWTRSATWRELIAQSFDNPITAGMVPHINRVDISYDAGAESAAMLLAGWLTSRIGFTPESVRRGPMSVTLRANGTDPYHSIIISLDPSHSSGFGLRAVRIQANDGGRVARVRVRRDERDHSSVRIQTTGMPAWERVVPHLNRPRHQLIASELMCFDRDRIYDEALADAAAFAAKCLDAE